MFSEWFNSINMALNAAAERQIAVWESIPAFVMAIVFVLTALSVANLTGWPSGYEKDPEMAEGHRKFEKELYRNSLLLIIITIVSFGVSWMLTSTGNGCCVSVTESFIRVIENAILFPIVFFGVEAAAIGFVYVWVRMFG